MPRNNSTASSRFVIGSIARLVAIGACLVVCSTMVVQVARFNTSQAADAEPGEQQESTAESKSDRKFRRELIRGKVVWLAEALKNNFGISTVPEVEQYGLAMLTSDGQLFPIVENLRGRAFRKDERLRQMEIEILARRYERQPLIQVLRVYQIDAGQRYELDYWCDVCAIVMFETGPCACCQDDNRLRRQLVTADGSD